MVLWKRSTKPLVCGLLPLVRVWSMFSTAAAGRRYSRVAQPFDQGICIVTFVPEQRAATDAFEQWPCSANIVDVTRGQNEPDLYRPRFLGHRIEP